MCAKCLIEPSAFYRKSAIISNLMDPLETQSSSTASKHSLVSYEKTSCVLTSILKVLDSVNRNGTMITSIHTIRNVLINVSVLNHLNRIPNICVYHNGATRTRILLVEKLFLKVSERNYATRPQNNTPIDWQFMVWVALGKTQIAIEYVTKFETEYVGIYWITASSEAELLSGFQAIANETRCVDTESLTLSEIAQRVLNWLYRSKDWLLVLDNLDDITIAEGYLPRIRIGGGHVLITTRNPNSLNIPAEGMQIDVHEPDEAKDLLLRRTQMFNEIGNGSKVEEEAKAIVKVLGYLALAIEQAAAYIREELKDIFKFCTIYATQRSQFHYRQSTCNAYYKNTIATTWLMSMEAVESRNHQAGQLLRLLAFMNPDGISLGFLEAGRYAFPDNFKSGTETAFIANLRKALEIWSNFR